MSSLIRGETRRNAEFCNNRLENTQDQETFTDFSLLIKQVQNTCVALMVILLSMLLVK